MGQKNLQNIVFLLLLAQIGGQASRPGSPPANPDIMHFLETFPGLSLIGPGLLRADSQENFYIQMEGVSEPLDVSFSILDVTRTKILQEDSIRLGPENNFHALKAIQIPSTYFTRDNRRTFVYLKVKASEVYFEKKVMVSFHAGYIFIQMDKPIYKPGDKVNFRAFVSSPSFNAMDGTITVDIQSPEGVVFKQIERIRAAAGVFRDTFPLPETASEGTWTVVARFDNWKQNTFTCKFQVKKYVLPAFNVTLTPRKSFLDVNDEGELVVEISARYLYGEPVQGTAYVMFGLKINKEMRRLPLVKQVSELDGGVVKLTMDEIKRTYPNIKSLVGSSIYVKASVLTKTGSDLVEAERTGIHIVESPYVLSFKDTPKYFKPGLPFDFTIQVSHHDGSPAKNVQVKVSHLHSPLLVPDGSTRGTVNMPRYPEDISLLAETVQPGLKPEQQAKYYYRISPYVPRHRGYPNFLYISSGATSVSVGDRLSLKMTMSTARDSYRAAIRHITYLVINKGKIIQADRIVASGQLVTSVGLTITPEMMPSFRVVAFYSLPLEVVADSIWVDVADSCVGDLKVEPTNNSPPDYKPGKSFTFQIRGDPGAKVSLVAVDNAVYLLNKNRLTQGQIWNVVEQGDIGCTRGGGRNSMGVFLDAGLLYISTYDYETQLREDVECEGNARRRRSAELLQRKAQLENHYKEKLLQRCCRDGLKDIPMSYSCTRRSLYITEGWECIQAFRHCCGTYRGQVIDRSRPTTAPILTDASATSRPSQPGETFPQVIPPFLDTSDRGRDRGAGFPEPSSGRRHTSFSGGNNMGYWDEDEEYMDESQLYLRSKFFESWLWTDVNLPNEAKRDGLASTVVVHSLPDTITQWGVTAVSSSPRTGFCVAQPFNIRAWKRFFVDLRLPYSVARNEQLEIKAVVHNYGDEDLQVRVILSKTNGMCSVAFKDKHITELVLPAGSSKAVPYTIVPLEVGKLPLEVAVVGRDMMGGDRIQKMLRVVMEGVQKTEVRSVVLNPAAEGGTQTILLEKVKLESVVPNSVPETSINIRGNMPPERIEGTISETSLGSAFWVAGGNVEDNLASMSRILSAAIYLERTNTWENTSPTKKAFALEVIRKVYNNQLMFRGREGGYSPEYTEEEASTWLTAFVVKMFSMASSFIRINQRDVCEPLIFLVVNRLRRHGFVERCPVFNIALTGGHPGKDYDMKLTAFALIAFAEARQAGFQCVNWNQMQIIQVAYYLQMKMRMPGQSSHTVAICAYALALLQDLGVSDPTEVLLRAAAPGHSHWPDPSVDTTMEATGYALLALVKMGRMKEAAAPVKWLTHRYRRRDGVGYVQDTMVVLQALSEYLIKVPDPSDFNLDVDIKMSGRKEVRYHFNPVNAYSARMSKLPAQVDLEVVAKGNGQGVLEAVTYYNQMHEVDEKKPCEHFELSVSIQESSEKPPADIEKYFQISINVRALGPSDVRMVILDISLPTGFVPENSDLEKLSNSVDRYINYFQVDGLRDRGSLILHLAKVSHREPEMLTFRLQQAFKVGLLQPSSVTVYKYSNPDHRCSRTYRPSEDREALDTICRENVCRCTQGDCAVSKTDQEIFSNKERETFACKSLHHVFQVKVLSVDQSYYDKYQMEITQVIKLGVEDGVVAGQRRFFMSHGVCREGLRLTPGSQYLLIGPKEDLWEADKDTNQFIYMLGKDTWVERWPSPAECSGGSGLRDKCQRLTEAARELSTKGCRL